MLISHTHKFIFIKTRKVGGTSLEKYIIDNHFDTAIDQCTGSVVDGIPWYNLPDGTRGHMDWSGIVNIVDKVDNINAYRVFTIDRNPWDKCVSQYFFFKDKIKTIPEDMTFSEFLRNPSNLPVDSPRYNNAPVIIFQWEHMQHDMPVLFDKLGVEFDSDKFAEYNLKSGIRKDKHYSEMYTDEDIEIVANAFEWEIENLKYAFEDCR